MSLDRMYLQICVLFVAIVSTGEINRKSLKNYNFYYELNKFNLKCQLFDNTITQNTCQSSFMIHVYNFNAGNLQFTRMGYTVFSKSKVPVQIHCRKVPILHTDQVSFNFGARVNHPDPLKGTYCLYFFALIKWTTPLLIQGGARDAWPLFGPISFNFMQFSAEILPRFCPHLTAWCLLLGNPGSATEPCYW